MSMIITAKDNDKIKYTKSLLKSKNRNKESKFIIEGYRILTLAIECRAKLDYVFINEDFEKKQEHKEFLETLKKKDIRVYKTTNKIFEEYSKCRKAYFEINNQVILKTVFDYLNIKLSISFSQAEKIIWNHSANIVAVEGVLELLDSLKCLGIRSAVISNLDFSGYLLEEKLNELLPNNAFEFVIASSDYGIRKPQKLIFEIGISKSG